MKKKRKQAQQTPQGKEIEENKYLFRLKAVFLILEKKLFRIVFPFPN